MLKLAVENPLNPTNASIAPYNNETVNDINTSLIPGYFSEETNAKARIALGVILVLLTCAAIFGNILVLLAICRTRFLRRLNNYLIISLAAIDLTASFLIMPLFAADLFNNSTWIFPKEMCPPYTGLALSYSVVSVLNVTAISLERVFIITQPMSYQRLVTPTRMAVVILAIWVLGFTYGMLQILWFTQDSYVGYLALENLPKCRFSPSFHFAVVHVSLLFFVPLIIMIGAYMKIFSVVQSQMKRIKPSMTDTWDETISEIPNHSVRLDDINSVDVRPNSAYDSIYSSRRAINLHTDTSTLASCSNYAKNNTAEPKNSLDHRSSISCDRSRHINTSNIVSPQISTEDSTENTESSAQKLPRHYWKRVKTILKFLPLHKRSDTSNANNDTNCIHNGNNDTTDVDNDTNGHNNDRYAFDNDTATLKDNDSGLGIYLKGVTTSESVDQPSNFPSTSHQTSTFSPFVSIPSTSGAASMRSDDCRPSSKQAWLPSVTKTTETKEGCVTVKVTNEETTTNCHDDKLDSKNRNPKISVLVTTPDGSPLNVRKNSLDRPPFQPTPILKKSGRTRSLKGVHGLPKHRRILYNRKRSNSDSAYEATYLNHGRTSLLISDGFRRFEINRNDNDDTQSVLGDVDHTRAFDRVTFANDGLPVKRQIGNYLTVDACQRRNRSRSLPIDNSLDDVDITNLKSLELTKAYNESQLSLRKEATSKNLKPSKKLTLSLHSLNTDLSLTERRENGLTSGNEKIHLSKSDTCLNSKLSVVNIDDKHPLSFQKKLVQHSQSMKAQRNTSIKRRLQSSKTSLKDTNVLENKVKVTESTSHQDEEHYVSVMPWIEKTQYHVVFLEPVPEATTPDIEKSVQSSDNTKTSPLIDRKSDTKGQGQQLKGQGQSTINTPTEKGVVGKISPECIYLIKSKESDESSSNLNSKSSQPSIQTTDCEKAETVAIWREIKPNENVVYLQTIRPDPKGKWRYKVTSQSFSYAKAGHFDSLNLQRSSTVSNLTAAETPLLIPLNQLKLQSAIKKTPSTDTVGSSMSKRGSVVFKLHDEEISIIDGKLTINHVLNKNDDSSEESDNDNVSCASNNIVTLETTSSGSNHGSFHGNNRSNQGSNQGSNHGDRENLWNSASKKHTKIWAKRHFQLEMGSRGSLHRNASNASETTNSNTPRLSRRSRPSFRRRLQENKAARMTAYVIGAFALCWLPYEILFLIQASCDNACTPDIAWSVVTVTMFLQAAINPFIYNFYSSEFRKATRTLFLGRKNRINPGLNY